MAKRARRNSRRATNRRRRVHVLAIDRDRVLRTAEKYAARSRYKQAIEEYQKVLEQTPNDARLLLKVGDLYARMHSHAWAVDTYARAGRIYADDGFAAKAVAVYKQVQQLIDDEVPHLADYYLYVYPTLASLYQELRLAVEAVGMYDAYASMLTRCGRLREAATILRVVVELGGDNPLTRLRLAELLLEEGDEAEALSQFLAAANGLVAVGRLDESLRVLDRTLVRVQDARIARRAAEIHLDRGQGNDGMQALVRLQQAFKAQPKNLETLALLARAFEAIDQKDRAFEVRKETVRIAKDQGAMDTARAVLDVLIVEAPNDPAVQALAKTIAPPPPQPVEPPPSAAELESNIPEVSAELLSPVEAEASVERHAVVVDTDLPVIEEAGAASDRAQEVESTLLGAQAFLERGETSSAIFTLQMGVEQSPGALSLRLMLKALLVDAGELDQAVEELLAIAELQQEAGQVAQAVEHLREALALIPEHPGATNRLFTLAPAVSMLEAPPVPSELLADADVEEVEPTELAPVPSEILADADLVGHSPLKDIRGFRGGGAVADAIDEAEFFASRGLFEDALAILEEQRARFPEDASLLERTEEIRIQAEAAHSEAQPSVLGVAIPTQQATRLTQGADPAFLETALADLEAPAPDATIKLEGGTLDVDDLFAAFKAGIAAQVGEEDSEMHYDLGLAYLEMGRLSDAIEAFRKATANPSRACVSLSMIASVHQRQGNLAEALAVLEEAAQVPRKTREEEVGVHYELANLHEAREEVPLAIEHFEQVVRLAPDFRDARARLKTLRRQVAPADVSTRGDDEFERAFDGLLSDPDGEESS